MARAGAGQGSTCRVVLEQTRVVPGLCYNRPGADASPQGDLNGSRRKFVCASNQEAIVVDLFSAQDEAVVRLSSSLS